MGGWWVLDATSKAEVKTEGFGEKNKRITATGQNRPNLPEPVPYISEHSVNSRGMWPAGVSCFCFLVALLCLENQPLCSVPWYLHSILQICLSLSQWDLWSKLDKSLLLNIWFNFIALVSWLPVLLPVTQTSILSSKSLYLQWTPPRESQMFPNINAVLSHYHSSVSFSSLFPMLRNGFYKLSSFQSD